MSMAKKNPGKSKRRNIVIITIVTVVVIVICGAALLWPKPATDAAQTVTPAEGKIQINGTAVCLPHKDTSGPQTMECAYGLKDDTGRYYALQDTDPGYNNINSIPMNTQITISGTFKKKSNATYPTVGTIEVTSVAK
jgi:hypothetical protein